MNVVAQKRQMDSIEKIIEFACSFSPVCIAGSHVKTKVGAVIKYGDCLPFVYQELTTTNMEEYVDYLKGKIQECELEDMHVSVSVYKEVLNTYLFP
jgi:hypothetical protein